MGLVNVVTRENSTPLVWCFRWSISSSWVSSTLARTWWNATKRLKETSSWYHDERRRWYCWLPFCAETTTTTRRWLRGRPRKSGDPFRRRRKQNWKTPEMSQAKHSSSLNYCCFRGFVYFSVVLHFPVSSSGAFVQYYHSQINLVDSQRRINPRSFWKSSELLGILEESKSRVPDNVPQRHRCGTVHVFARTIAVVVVLWDIPTIAFAGHEGRHVAICHLVRSRRNLRRY